MAVKISPLFLERKFINEFFCGKNIPQMTFLYFYIFRVEEIEEWMAS